MARQTIKQRIALDGGKEIEAELRELGKVGEEAFRRLQEAANKVTGVGDKFLRSLQDAQKALKGVATSFQNAGRDIQKAGRSLTTRLTLPILGAGAGILKSAGDFETAMNEFVANTGVAGDAFDQAKQKAIDLGNASVFSAGESAQAMVELAKVGLSYEQIMEGAAEATVNLAAANGAELGPAAAVAGDIINQFGLKAKDLGSVINGVSGTLIQSKLDFDGYRLALGQAGGTAGALGVSLEDFNAVLAATSSSFASGSDAGTSFKTFLQRLTPNTKKAAALFKELNLNFFDAQGNMRSMSEIAEELQTKLAGLSEEQLNEKLGELFGTDAIRTAIALMKQGGEGIDDMLGKLANTDAARLAEVRIKGLNGALDQFKSALETLAIAIGDSGLLEFATGMVLKLTDFIKELAKTNPELLKWGTLIAGVAAVIGPFVFGLGLMVSGIGLLLGGLSRVVGLFSGVFVALRTAVALFGGFFGILARGAAAFIPLIASIISWPALLVAAIVAAGAAIFIFWDEIVAGAERAIAAVQEFFSPENLARVFQGLLEGARQAGSLFVQIWQLQIEAVGVVFAGLAQVVTGFVQGIIGEIGRLAGELLPTWEGIAAGGAAVWQRISEGATATFETIQIAASGLVSLLEPVWLAISTAGSAVWTTIATAASTAFNGIVTVLSTAITAISDTIGTVAGAVVEAFSGATSEVAAAATAIGDAIQRATEAASDIEGAADLADRLVEPFRQAASAIDGIMSGIRDVVQNGFSALISAIRQVASEVQSQINRILSALRQAAAEAARLRAQASSSGDSSSSSGQGFASGGRVFGPGTSTSDSIPARLSVGEFVTKARAVKYYGADLFHALNNLRLPKGFLKELRGFSIGGAVDHVNRSMAIPRFATGGLADFEMMPAQTGGGFSGTPVTLVLDQEPFEMVAPVAVAAKLATHATASQNRSAGRAPGWV